MFKTEKSYPILPPDSIVITQYIIQPGDILQLAVFSNNGYSLVDVISQQGSAFSALDYRVKQSGMVNFPMLDSIYLAGMTVDAAERLLREKYSYFFVDPLVRLEVTNMKVYVFRGRNTANTIELEREYMNLLEVLALSGGMPEGGKAYKVRIIRGNLKDPKIILVDLSTVEGIKAANLTIQANDYIYIEPTFTLNDVLEKVTPIFTLVSLAALVGTLINTF